MNVEFTSQKINISLDIQVLVEINIGMRIMKLYASVPVILLKRKR